MFRHYQKDLRQILWLMLLAGVLFFLVGCASLPSKSEDSEHVVAKQAQPQAIQAGTDQVTKIFGQGYYSKSKSSNDSNCSGKSSWNISSDGRNGSMTQTSVRTWRNTYDNESGSLVGPAGAFYGQGYCGYGY